MSKLFFIMVTLVLPSMFFIFALYKKQFIPFLLGILAFTLSQLVIRIPLLQVIAQTSSTYQLWTVTKPLMILMLLALSAGIAEEMARWLLIKRFLRAKSLENGVMFGLGHGGIEALIVVGIPVIVNSHLIEQSSYFIFSGVERLLAICIHVCLSIIVLTGARNNKFFLCTVAIIIHTTINFVTAYCAQIAAPAVVEGLLAVLTCSLVLITIQITRGINYEKNKSFND